MVASPWRRLVASVVDSLLLIPLSFLLARLAGADPLNATPLQDLLFNWMPSWAYFTLFTAYLEATPGKMLLGLKVVREDGKPMDLLTAFLREVVGKTLSTLPLGLGYLWAFFNRKRQAWHDLIADTLVVRAGEGEAAPPSSGGPAAP